MKLLRPIILSVGVVLLLGVVAIGLALTPPVQQWALRRAAAKQPGLHFEVAELSVGLSSFALQGVRAEHRGIKITFDRLNAEYSPWALIFSRRLELGQLTVRGLLVDATRLSPQEAQTVVAVAPAVASGLLARVQLPWELSLDNYAVQGRLLLAGAVGEAPLQGEFKLQGGPIGPGQSGKHLLKAQLKNQTPGARVNALAVRATLQLRESREGTFDAITVGSQLEATGPGLPGPSQLKLVAEMNRTLAGERYRVAVDTVRAGQGENLFSCNLVHAPTDSVYTGDWVLTARAEQLETFLLGHELPKFTANGFGRMDFSPAPASVSWQGTLQIDVTEFPSLRPELRALGKLHVKSDFDLKLEPGMVRLRKLAIGVAGDQPVLDLRTIGPLDFNLKQRRFEAAGATPGEILRVKLAGLPFAWVAPFFPAAQLAGGPLSGELSLIQGETGQFTLQTVTPLQMENFTASRAGRTWLAQTGLKIDASADFTPAQVLLQIRALNLKSAAGDSLLAKCVVTAPPSLRLPLKIEGDLVANLPSWSGPLLAGGPLMAKGAVDLTWQEDRVEVRRLVAESSDAKGNLLCSLTANSPIVYDLEKGRVATDGAGEMPLAKLKLGQLPLLTFPEISKDWSAVGRLGPGEATLSASGAKLILRATAPLPLFDFSVARGKKPVLDHLKLQMQPVLEFADGAWVRIQSGVVAVQTATDVPLAGLSLEFTQTDSGLRAASTFNFDLPAWSSQPIMLGHDGLSSGLVNGELRASRSDAGTQVEARATFNNLITEERGQTLPVANLSLRADFDAAGHFSMLAPVLLDRAGLRSDLQVSAEGSVGSSGLSVEAKLTSGHIELRDLLMLVAVTGSSLGGEGAESVAAQSRALSPPPADLAPFWAGTTGQVTLECQNVVNGRDWIMSGLTGRMKIDGDRLQLEKLEADFDEKCRFTAQGNLAFSAGLNPYQLAGDFSLTDFDLGHYLRSADPEQPPALEGLFRVQGRLEGEGLTFDDTIERTRGRYDLTSRQGLFRGLKRWTDKRSMASKAVELVSTLLGDKSAEKLTGNAYQIEQLAAELAEINYDQFTVSLVRDPALNLKLENLTLVAQQIRLFGAGQVTYAAGQPLLEQNLSAKLSLRARDKVAEILGRLKVLEGNLDELGYGKCREELSFGGTLAKPDPQPFFNQLAGGKPTENLAPAKPLPEPTAVAPAVAP